MSSLVEEAEGDGIAALIDDTATANVLAIHGGTRSTRSSLQGDSGKDYAPTEIETSDGMIYIPNLALCYLMDIPACDDAMRRAERLVKGIGGRPVVCYIIACGLTGRKNEHGVSEWWCWAVCHGAHSA